MPIYEYRCHNGHNFDVLQRMADDPVTVCEVCEASVQRVFHPIAVHFKGKGFYNTDYGTKNRQRELKETGEGGSATTSDGASSDGKAAETKSSDSSSSSSADSSSSSSDSSKSGSSSDNKQSGEAAKKTEKAA